MKKECSEPGGKSCTCSRDQGNELASGIVRIVHRSPRVQLQCQRQWCVRTALDRLTAIAGLVLLVVALFLANCGCESAPAQESPAVGTSREQDALGFLLSQGANLTDVHRQQYGPYFRFNTTITYNTTRIFNSTGKFFIIYNNTMRYVNPGSNVPNFPNVPPPETRVWTYNVMVTYPPLVGPLRTPPPLHSIVQIPPGSNSPVATVQEELTTTAAVTEERTTEPLPTSEAIEATEIPDTTETMAVELETTAAALTTVAATSPTTTRPVAAALVKGNQCWLRETSRRDIVDVYNRVRTIPSYDCGEVEIGTEEHSLLTQQQDLRKNTICALDEHCQVNEKIQDLFLSKGGVENILTASRCGCRNRESPCQRRSLIERHYPGTALESAIDVGACHGVCSKTGEACQAIEETSVTIPSPAGQTCVKNITACGCAGSCVFQRQREVYRELKLRPDGNGTYVVDKVVQTGICVGTCTPRYWRSFRTRCVPDWHSYEDWFVGHHGKLLKAQIVTGCICQ